MPERLNILVVEDNPADAHLIAIAFEECGRLCNLTFAASMPEAEKLLGNSFFHLMVLDISLPPDNGAVLIQSIRANPAIKMIPIVVLSGSNQVKEAYDAGANCFIKKPADLDELLAKIRKLMEFWTTVAQIPFVRPSDD